MKIDILSRLCRYLKIDVMERKDAKAQSFSNLNFGALIYEIDNKSNLGHVYFIHPKQHMLSVESLLDAIVNPKKWLDNDRVRLSRPRKQKNKTRNTFAAKIRKLFEGLDRNTLPEFGELDSEWNKLFTMVSVFKMKVVDIPKVTSRWSFDVAASFEKSRHKGVFLKKSKKVVSMYKY